MVKKVTILAIMVALASAAPIANDMSPRTFPSLGGFVASSGSVTSGLTTTKGWTTGVASSLEACAVGVTSGCVEDSAKTALASWISGAGAAFFDTATCKEIKTWCTSSSDVVLAAWAQTAMEGALVAESSISAAGGILSFFNGVIESSFEGESCSCSALGSGDLASLSAFLSGSTGAALESVEATIFGSLKMCASGGIAEVLSSSARASLSAWLSGPSCTLSADLIGSIEGWLSGTVSGGAAVGGSSISESVSGNVLSSSAMGSLSAFMSESAFVDLSIEIKLGLYACSAGGISASLSGAIQASLSAWLSSSSCTMDAGLKASMQAWLAGTEGTSTQVGTSVDAFGYISTGASIAGNFNASGFMTASVQASLSSFCGSSAGLALDVSILTSLKSCASGELSSSLEVAAASALAEYLASSSCTLEAEMRGSVIMWLSLGITGASGASAGVGAGAGAGFTISTEMATEFASAVSAGFNLSSSCKGSMGVAISGEAAWAVSISGRAEMIAYLVSGEAAGLSAEVETAMFGWLMGSDCSGGKTVGSSSSSSGSSSGSSSSESSSGSSSSASSSEGSSSGSESKSSGSSSGEEGSGDETCDA
ncbi:uncharacterized protein LY89DRAFT_726328 [Mollisia scopiformis]|uniref:Uncharacterized protein n=1 Tax=Mollisia scopiformis TaxID=149040 RepID=A0A132B2N3_MOLSC|nr:uncharacterized protein LY89DRAFT_726328 [Mollisia scopiformis]KUJ06652.1 hypothetical protein LY89DRAFT_726328 [Mollisia scopiformis]